MNEQRQKKRKAKRRISCTSKNMRNRMKKREIEKVKSRAEEQEEGRAACVRVSPLWSRVSEYQNISRFYKVVRGGRGRGRLSAWYLEPLSSYSCSSYMSSHSYRDLDTVVKALKGV